jgi:hypothetical protein
MPAFSYSLYATKFQVYISGVCGVIYNKPNLILLLSFSALTQCDPPRTEIVSIFNNQYNIPAGFGPFFIKINRCVQCDTCGTEFLIPNVTTLVKAVVQNSITGKVFEYTLHDHISCMCGPITNQKTKYYESTVKEGRNRN